jgi:L-fuconolactonase
MRIDAHHHVWDLAVRDQPWTAGFPTLRRGFSFDELRPALERHRVDASVVVQTGPVFEETAELLAAGDSHVVGWVDLTGADVADRLAELLAAPGGRRLVGVRHQVQDEPNPGWLRRVDVRSGLAAVSDAGLAYDLLVRPPQLAAALDTVRSRPELRFVLDHAGKPPVASGMIEPWQRFVAELAAEPNVAVKLSGLVTEADPDGWTVEQLRPYADVVLEQFGADRTMFGSDWPVCLIAAGYDEVLYAAEQLTDALSASERVAVFGETARRWYRIGE